MVFNKKEQAKAKEGGGPMDIYGPGKPGPAKHGWKKGSIKFGNWLMILFMTDFWPGSTVSYFTFTILQEEKSCFSAHKVWNVFQQISDPFYLFVCYKEAEEQQGQVADQKLPGICRVFPLFLLLCAMLWWLCYIPQMSILI